MVGDEESMAPEAAHIATNKPPADEAGTIQALVTAGDYQAAITHCARAYSAPLGRLCMAFTGSQAESEELVQETFIAAYDGLSQFRGDGSVKAWLFGIARRICGRHNEMRNRRQARLKLVQSNDSAPDAADLALAREQATRARAALERLKPSEREAVVLRYDAELSFRELAIACGVEEAAARKRVSRALTRLRADLSEE